MTNSIFPALILAAAATVSMQIPSATAETHIEFLADISGSMSAKLASGQTKIDAARVALLKTLEGVPAGVKVAFRAFGHRVPQSDKTQSCLDTELLIPFATPQRTTFEEKLSALKPLGYTPIAHSLEQAEKDFNSEAEAQRVIILLSDGEETCGGDPVAVAKSLRDRGYKLTIHTVGFEVDAATRAQLEAIAKEGNGKYFNAKGGDGLIDALQGATAAAALIAKTKSIYGNEIRGGDSYESAAPLELGKEYRLDHHQRADQFDYFYVDLIAGQGITLTGQTLEKGILRRSDGTIEETTNCHGGLALHDDQRAKIRAFDVYSCNGREQYTWASPEARRVYILVGARSHMIHKDHFTFSVALENSGDLGGAVDAGPDIASALPVELGKTYTNSIHDKADVIDVFSVSLEAGKEYEVGLAPGGEEYVSLSVNVRVADEFTPELARRSFSHEPGKLAFRPTSTEPHFFLVKTSLTHGRRAAYRFVVRPVAAAE